MVAELVRARKHVEPYEVKSRGTVWHRRHPSIVPSLLAQLEHARPSGAGGERSGGYESRLPIRRDAIDALILIDHEASRWLRVDLGLDDPGSTVECVSHLGGLLPSLTRCSPRPVRDKVTRKVTCCPRHRLEDDIAHWWTRARVITGWDVAPFAPDNTCPTCSKRGGLRVRTFDAFDASGVCIECGTVWDASTIGLLAEHIRLENREDDQAIVEPPELVELLEVAVVVPAEQNRGW